MGYGVKGRMVRSLRLARDRDTVLNQQTEKQNQEDKKQTNNNLPHNPNTNHQTKHIPMFINDLILYLLYIFLIQLIVNLANW